MINFVRMDEDAARRVTEAALSEGKLHGWGGIDRCRVYDFQPLSYCAAFIANPSKKATYNGQ